MNIKMPDNDYSSVMAADYNRRKGDAGPGFKRA